MKRQVLGTKLLTTPVENKTTESGIVIPDTSDVKTKFKVHHVGVDTTVVRPNDVIWVFEAVAQRGQTVDYNGTTFNVFDENTVIIHERS